MNPITLIALTTERPSGGAANEKGNREQAPPRPQSDAPTLLCTENADRRKSAMKSEGLVGSKEKPWELFSAVNDESDAISWGLQRPFSMGDEELPRCTLEQQDAVWQRYLTVLRAVAKDIAKVPAWGEHQFRMLEWAGAPNGTDIFRAELQFDVDEIDAHEARARGTGHVAYLIRGIPQGEFWPMTGWMIDTTCIKQLWELCNLDESPSFSYIEGVSPECLGV